MRRKTLKAVLLGLAVAVTVAVGAVFPVPPLIVLTARRRTDRTELILPANPGGGLDLGRFEVPAGLVDRESPAGG